VIFETQDQPLSEEVRKRQVELGTYPPYFEKSKKFYWIDSKKGQIIGINDGLEG